MGYDPEPVQMGQRGWLCGLRLDRVGKDQEVDIFRKMTSEPKGGGSCGPSVVDDDGRRRILGD